MVRFSYMSAPRLVALAGASLFLTSLLPLEPARSGETGKSTERLQLAAAGQAEPGRTDPATSASAAPSRKGDRLAASRRMQPTSVITAELTGHDNSVIVLKDRYGATVYRSDPKAATTMAVKNTDLPSVTVKHLARNPAKDPVAVQVIQPPRPASAPNGRQIGCNPALSPLVSPNARAGQSLCLT